MSESGGKLERVSWAPWTGDLWVSDAFKRILFIFLRAVFRFIAKLWGKYREFPIHSLPQLTDSLPQNQHLPAICTDGWTGIMPPKSIVDVKVHSWWCTFYGLGRRMILLTSSITWSSCTVQKSLYYCTCSSLPAPLGHCGSILSLQSLAFSRMSDSWIHRVGDLFKLACLCNHLYLGFLCVFAWLTRDFFHYFTVL